MELLKRSECLRWCERKGIPLSRNGKPEIPSVSEIEEFSIPADAGQRVALVRQHVALFEGDAEVLIWITDWSVWPSGEQIHMFDRFRLSYGFESGLTERPGHLLKNNEFEELSSLVTFAALFLWDCYVVAADGRKSLFYSHDEFGTVTRSGVEPGDPENGWKPLDDEHTP